MSSVAGPPLRSAVPEEMKSPVPISQTRPSDKAIDHKRREYKDQETARSKTMSDGQATAQVPRAQRRAQHPIFQSQPNRGDTKRTPPHHWLRLQQCEIALDNAVAPERTNHRIDRTPAAKKHPHRRKNTNANKIAIQGPRATVQLTDGTANSNHLQMPPLQLLREQRIRRAVVSRAKIKVVPPLLGADERILGRHAALWIPAERISPAPELAAHHERRPSPSSSTLFPTARVGVRLPHTGTTTAKTPTAAVEHHLHAVAVADRVMQVLFEGGQNPVELEVGVRRFEMLRGHIGRELTDDRAKLSTCLGCRRKALVSPLLSSLSRVD